MFNFRPDRMREICAMLLGKNLPPEVSESLVRPGHVQMRPFNRDNFAGLTEYDPKLEMEVAFPKETITESCGEVIAREGLKQFRCAETEKYAHVTYFFNGGREAAFEGEERKLVPSPRDVPTYDKKPEMSAEGVTRAVVEAIKSDAYDFILVNYANPDMVGHTGVLDAATHAVEAVDVGIGEIRDAVLEKGGALIITADHGNCETMVDEQGNPHTAHTTNPVPLYYVSAKDKDVTLRSGGRIADVAPTMLEILGIEKPAAMTGQSLREPHRAGDDRAPRGS
jgi:2,3-bisphosphoglycerate-independent phosphoglycerate mutase